METDRKKDGQREEVKKSKEEEKGNKEERKEEKEKRMEEKRGSKCCIQSNKHSSLIALKISSSF